MGWNSSWSGSIRYIKQQRTDENLPFREFGSDPRASVVSTVYSGIFSSACL